MIEGSVAGRVRWAPVLAVFVVLGLASCGDRGQTEPPTKPAATIPRTAPEPATIATNGTPTTEVIYPATSTTAPPTTTSAVVREEQWHVDGRTYYFPVQPPDLASYGPEHHDYPATDIFAPVGTTLVAVTAGFVDEVGTTDGWDQAVDDPATRSGLYVSIVGADGIRYYYSHLNVVEPGIEAGAAVDAGRVIGAVGKSGNARETPSHVHFGISHPTFPGDWEVRRGEVSPYPYLSAWVAGDQLKPELE